MRLLAAALLVAAAAAGSSAAAGLAVLPASAAGGAAETLVGEASALVEVVGVGQAASEQFGPQVPEVPDIVPTLLQGIGPGSPIHTSIGLCSTAFLVRQPGEERYFLATAGHCLAAAASQPPVTGLGTPSAVVAWVDVCYRNCTGYPESGTFVHLEASPGYHPVGFATRSTADFGLIAIPVELNGLVRAALPLWGGPADIAAPAVGDLLLVYGHGNSVCNGCQVRRTPADQGRLGLETPLGHMLPTAKGDSGGLVAVVELDAAGAPIATHAYAVVNGPTIREPGSATGIPDVSVDGPFVRVTTMAAGLAAAEPLLGFLPDLVPGAPAVQP